MTPTEPRSSGTRPKPASMNARGVAASRAAVHANLAAHRRQQSAQGIGQLRLAVAGHAGDAEDLAALDRKVRVLAASRRPRVDAPTTALSARAVGAAASRLRGISMRRPTISSASSALLVARSIAHRNQLALPQHRHAPARRQHLVQLVRDEDDRQAVHAPACAASRTAPRDSCGVSTAVGSSRIRMRAPR